MIVFKWKIHPEGWIFCWGQPGTDSARVSAKTLGVRFPHKLRHQTLEGVAQGSRVGVG